MVLADLRQDAPPAPRPGRSRRRAGAGSRRSAGRAPSRTRAGSIAGSPRPSRRTSARSPCRSARCRANASAASDSRVGSDSAPLALAQLLEHRVVGLGARDDRRERVVLRRGADHRRAADVDVLDRPPPRRRRGCPPCARTGRGSRTRGRRTRSRVSVAARTCSGLSRTASRPPWSRGCSVLTRPSMISGKPVKSSIARTSRPAPWSSRAVPPVETSSTPSSARPRAKSTTPVLSETDTSARRMRTAPGGTSGSCARCVGDSAMRASIARGVADPPARERARVERASRRGTPDSTRPTRRRDGEPHHRAGAPAGAHGR